MYPQYEAEEEELFMLRTEYPLYVPPHGCEDDIVGHEETTPHTRISPCVQISVGFGGLNVTCRNVARVENASLNAGCHYSVGRIPVVKKNDSSRKLRIKRSVVRHVVSTKGRVAHVNRLGVAYGKRAPGRSPRCVESSFM